MSKVLSILTFFLIFLFVLVPEFSLVSAADTVPCSSFGINQEILNQPNPVPDGLSSLQIKITGLTDSGKYQLRVGRGDSLREYYSDQSHTDTNMEVTLTITDSHILTSAYSPYSGTLEYTSDPSSANPSPGTNKNYCNNITYPIGGSGNCALTTNPTEIHTNQPFTVTATHLPPDHYAVTDSRGSNANNLASLDTNSQGTGTTNPISFFTNPGNYTLHIQQVVSGGLGGFSGLSRIPGGQCSLHITVAPPIAPGDLGIVGCTLLPADPTSSSKEYKVSVFNLKADVMSAIAKNRAYVATLSKDGGESKNTDTKVIGLTDDSVIMSLGNITEDGNYDYNVTGNNGLLCPEPHSFTVNKGATVIGLVPQECKDPATCSFAGGKKCVDGSNGIQTAIGCIHTSPLGFIKDFLTFITAIAGGLAFLMMLIGAFQILTSAGNPDTLHAGRNRLTNAVIGLLFIIFAVLLMQIIGVDILGIIPKLPK